ncbi:hypothetical protein PAXRUDRAFT_828599 [Paxillus rubicundulus Ve08.2h10]|uniref:Unplaced genomic scaffold scaffold_330, whole genome shotgun sequence n=1 Tax=Paxillus rubicundulus Ve08.2h10 TaxID=930991 RepID=A0A0D0DVY3_9AGAM|nr:hypothetical protein PAXRUDRAFT_828599 [Paxillus rubicundulus Ve08.2h10]
MRYMDWLSAGEMNSEYDAGDVHGKELGEERDVTWVGRWANEYASVQQARLRLSAHSTKRSPGRPVLSDIS